MCFCYASVCQKLKESPTFPRMLPFNWLSVACSVAQNLNYYLRDVHSVEGAGVKGDG